MRTSVAGTPATVQCVGNRLEHDAAGGDFAEGADFDIAEDLGARADHHAVADLRVAVAGLLAGAAERDVLQDRHFILDDRCFADDDARTVVEHDGRADPRRRMDIRAKDQRNEIGEPTGDLRTAGDPERMGDAMRLQRMKALEIEKRVQKCRAGRIALAHGDEIGLDLPHDIAIKCGQDEIEQITRFHLRYGEPRGQHAGDDLIVASSVRYLSGKQLPQYRLACGELNGLPIQPTRFSVLATPFTRDMAALPSLSEDLLPWKASLDAAVRNGELYSQPIPITDVEMCNSIGQQYGGPVVLISDSTTYSAGDLFSAGFVDNGIGPFVCVGEATGAGGANVWDYAELRTALAGSAIQLPALPDGIGLSLSYRRATRSGPSEGLPIEDIGISGATYALTRDDLLAGNRDLIAHCIGLLAQLPNTRMATTLDRYVANDHRDDQRAVSC